MRILCGTDFSEPSQRATDLAAALPAQGSVDLPAAFA